MPRCASPCSTRRTASSRSVSESLRDLGFNRLREHAPAAGRRSAWSSRLLRTSRSRTWPSRSAYHFSSLSSSSAGCGVDDVTEDPQRAAQPPRRHRVLCTAGVPVRIPTSLLASTSHCAARYAATSSPTVPASIVDACPSGKVGPRARSSFVLRGAQGRAGSLQQLPARFRSFFFPAGPNSTSTSRHECSIDSPSGGPDSTWSSAISNTSSPSALRDSVRRSSRHDRCDRVQALARQQALHALRQCGGSVFAREPLCSSVRAVPLGNLQLPASL